MICGDITCGCSVVPRSRQARGGAGKEEKAGRTVLPCGQVPDQCWRIRGLMRRLIKVAARLPARPWPHHPTQARGCVGGGVRRGDWSDHNELWSRLCRTARS